MADESDRLVPIANVGRIMKQILPPTAKISKGAKETMQECVTEFISFVTGEASDKCHKENRKTVNGDDICWALTTLGFDNYGEAITRYLYKYREFEREKAANCQGRSEEVLACGTQLERDEQDQLLETSSTFPSLEFRIIDPKSKTPFKNPSNVCKR